jgi:hypothetical protein
MKSASGFQRKVWHPARKLAARRSAIAASPRPAQWGNRCTARAIADPARSAKPQHDHAVILELENPSPVPYRTLYGSILPAPEASVFLWIAAAFLLGWMAWRSRNGGPPVSAGNPSYWAAAVALAGTYVYSSRWTDETFINLEHSYNLLHHGRFSFDSQQWIDGTVEPIYFLLLVPTAITREWLIRGGYILGFLVALGHLALLFRLVRRFDPALQLLVLLPFAFFGPFVEVCASGFGNGLVSLLFFYAMVQLAEGKSERALQAAAVLPLLRPDAILYSAVCFLAGQAWRRKLLVWPLLAAAALAGHLLLWRLVYGHWVATPIRFKSFRPSMLPLLATQWPMVWEEVLSVPAIVAYVSLIASLAFDPLRESRPAFRAIRLTLLPLAAIAGAYTLTGLGFHPTLFRYWAPFLLMQYVVPAHYVASVVDGHLKRGNARFAQRMRVVAALAAGVILLAGPWLLALPPGREGKAVGGRISRAESERINDFLLAGELLDKLLPPGWRVGTSELATFSFMNDRHVVDLWGYTNPAIATSPTCSAAHVRNNPAVLLDEQPEVVWVRTGTPGALWGVDESVGYEERLAGQVFNKWLNLFGSPLETLERYDVVRLAHFGHRFTYLFVRKDMTPILEGRLRARGFRRVGSRDLDRQKLDEVYRRYALIRFDCS